ncbi:MAG: putative Zn-dependent peptidase [Saprospiraceae bacterium]|jgi:predicted Zn-dependent peptidase
MKNILFIFSFIIFTSCLHWNKIAEQKPAKSIDHSAGKLIKNYSEVTGDPLKVREYTLDNGLKVFISPNKSEPRIQTLVLVKAGSIHDPADATGLAHYLEHMLFKGNDNMGTIDYGKEKIELDKIKRLFEDLKASVDTAERKLIYHNIDSISGVASQYACPNEITQMFSKIGAKGTNAYTSKEFTGYINNIPSNQLDNWLHIEAARYTNPILRLFHTELEAVYEEKNITLDKADRRMNEIFYDAIYPNHNYGQQTTIGTIAHLKSPSMVAIEKFYNTYYVPNNMAVFLSGDVNPDSALTMIKNHFGEFKSKEVPPYLFDNAHVFKSPVVRKMTTKEPEQLMIGFRFPGAGTQESYLVEMVDMLLNNRTAGLFDININQAQKAISSFSYPYVLKDYSTHVMGGTPNKGQSLDELKELLFSQLDLIKKGEFNDWMLEAVVNDLKKSEIKSSRSNKHRVSVMSDAFGKNIPWKVQTQHYDRLSKITKAEIVAFVNMHYKENYVAVYREQSDSVVSQQVEKPAITPIDVPADNRSKFLLDFSKQTPPKAIEPIFVKYVEEIDISKLDSNRTLYYQDNKQDSLFSLSFVIPFGSNHNANLSLATSYVELCGSKGLSLAQLNEKWYQLGIDFSLSVGEEESYISLSGLSNNMEAGLNLMQQRLLSVVADTVQLASLKKKAVQLRANSLTNKRHILWSGLKNYLVYDQESPFKSGLSNEAVKSKTSEQLLSAYYSTISSISEVYYYGPLSKDVVTEMIPVIDTKQNGNFELNSFIRVDTKEENEIFFLDFEMQQAEILMMHKSSQFSKEQLPVLTLFNEYFGGGMSSIVFQEIREKQALAYSVYAGYTRTAKREDPHYTLAYIGTQADKYEEAITAMINILEKLPYDSLKFGQAKEAIKQKYASNRIAEHGMLGAYRTDKKLGYSYDKRKDTFEKIDQLTFKDVEAFFNKFIKGQKYRIAVLGDVKKIDLKKLGAFGTVKQIGFKEIFPY